MKMFTTSVIALIVIILITLIYFNSIEIKVSNSPFIWTVSNFYGNYEDAAKLISEANNRILKFLSLMKTKYAIDWSNTGTYNNSDTRGKKIIQHILINYNPENIVENDPIFGSGTSYTIDKGKKMYVCCRSKENPHELVDINTLMFVLLHEIAHIGNYNGWGHGEDFWATFKFILKEATSTGIYVPENYDKYPKYYCGMDIIYQPLTDISLENIQ